MPELHIFNVDIYINENIIAQNKKLYKNILLTNS